MQPDSVFLFFILLGLAFLLADDLMQIGLAAAAVDQQLDTLLARLRNLEAARGADGD